MDDDVARGVRRADVDQVHGDAVQVGPRLPSACGYLDSHGWRQDVPPATDGGAPMRLRATCSVLPVALAVLASLVAGTSRAPAADDVLPPTLTCVDGLFTKIAPRPGELSFRRRRWFCDVDGQANGVCTFGRRCRQCFGCRGLRIRCGVTVPVPVGEREGPVILVCLSSSTPTPCGPTLTCDTPTEVCVAREQGGPGVFYSCEPVPAGCEADRSCRCVGAALCQPPSSTCMDDGSNAITCVCPACV